MVQWWVERVNYWLIAAKKKIWCKMKCINEDVKVEWVAKVMMGNITRTMHLLAQEPNRSTL